MLRQFSFLITFATIVFGVVGLVEYYFDNMTDDITDFINNPKYNAMKTKVIATKFKIHVHHRVEMLSSNSYKSVVNEAAKQARSDFEKMVVKTTTNDKQRQLAVLYKKELNTYINSLTSKDLVTESASSVINTLTSSYDKLCTNLNIITLSDLAKDEVDNNTIQKAIIKKYIDQLTSFTYKTVNNGN